MALFTITTFGIARGLAAGLAMLPTRCGPVVMSLRWRVDQSEDIVGDVEAPLVGCEQECLAELCSCKAT